MSNIEKVPLVSIALCVYNGEKYLGEQLDSLVNQTYANIEVIALDDCSTDSSVLILDDYALRYPFLHIVKNEQNLGYVKNFEKVLTRCKGEFIALSDQDDIWDLDKIRLQVENIHDHLLIYHDSLFIDENGKDLNKKMSDILKLYRGDEPKIFLLSNCVSGHACLFKRELLPEILPFHPDHFHDHWIAYVATNLGTIDFLPQCLVSYRQHTTSSTDILNKKKKWDENYHESRDKAKLERELKWLIHCMGYKKNKNQAFVNKFTRLFEKRLNSIFSFEYAWVMKKNYDLLFSNQKLRKSTKNGYIRRQVWGFKAKILWAQYFGKKS